MEVGHFLPELRVFLVFRLQNCGQQPVFGFLTQIYLIKAACNLYSGSKYLGSSVRLHMDKNQDQLTKSRKDVSES
jgi:hypothetical protein